MRIRPVRMTAVIMAVLATACAPSAQPLLVVTGSGTVTDAGSRADGATIAVRVEPPAGREVEVRSVAFGSLGVACALRVAARSCEEKVRSRTAHDGTYEFTVSTSQLPLEDGTTPSVSVAVSVPAGAGEVSGPLVAISSIVNSPRLVFGEFAVWRPDIDVDIDAEIASVTWTGRGPGKTGVARSYRVVFDDNRGGLVWQQDGPGPITFDTRLLEDATGGISVVAEVTGPLATSFTNLTYQSPRLAFAGASTPPLSRGAMCSAEEPAFRKHRGEGCALTDGDFAIRTPITSPVEVDLGRLTGVSMLAVRGCTSRCTVQGSADRVHWTSMIESAVNGTGIMALSQIR